MKVPAKLEDVVRTAGITLLVAFIASVSVLGIAPYDSGLRGFGHGAVSAVCWLYMVWAAVAMLTAGLRWRKVSKSFWLIFVINISIAGRLIADVFVNS